MSKLVVLWILALGGLLESSLAARDISGQWQGTLPVARPAVRVILKVTQTADQRR